MDKLKKEVEVLKRENMDQQETIRSLLEKIKQMENDNTYLESYTQRLKQIVLRANLIGNGDIKEMTKARHSRS